jgi:CHAT domain-containing protein/predicted negative regulator of RcsB-dependent stress response
MLSPIMTSRRGCLALALLAFVACRVAKPTPLTFRPGLSLSSEIRGGKVRSFAFQLHRDQYVALRVTQESLDVALTLHTPDGESWAPIDTQSVVPMPEILRVVAPRSGRYVLEVGAVGKGKEGPFSFEVTELRPATARDRLIAKAERSLAEAEELRRRDNKVSDLLALPLYEKAVGLFGKAADGAGEGYARVQWARVLQKQSRKEEAADCLRRCLRLPAASQAPGTQARAATLLAEVLADLGQNAAADAADQEALGEWRRLEKPRWEAKVINDLAIRAMERGELARAEGLYRQALGLFEGQKDAAAAAVALSNLASVYNMAAEPQLALDSVDQGLAKFPHDAPPEKVADALAQKGEALASLGRREASRSAFAEALKLLGRGAPSARAQLERRLARRAYDRGDFAEATRRFQSALTTLEATKDRQSVLATRQDLAWTELKRGHLDAADRLYKSLSAEIGSAENRWIEPASLAGRARLERARGHLESALALARQALEGVELIRREVGRTDLKTSVFAGQQSYFDLAADLLMDLYRRTGDRSLLAKGFEISESSRARRLLDLLAADRSLSPGPSPQAQTRAAGLLSQAEERLKALRAAGAPAPETDRAEQEVRRRVLDLRRTDPGGLAAIGGAPLSLREIQRRIDRDTVLLEFDLGEDASYLWVVSRRTLSVHRLPRQQEVDALARKALGVLSAPGISGGSVQGRATLLATSKLLVGEAMPELAARRWLLVMDGALHALPLGALPSPGNPGELLLGAHEIAYAPSASVAVRLSERERCREGEARKEQAVFADAVYEAGNAESSRRTATQGALRLPRLRFSDEEARRILALVPPDSVLDFRRFEATKARVLSGELAGYRRLHFAVHGLLDESHPELSGLALSLFDPQGRPQDGVLFAHEIARLDLPADLVVLSACQSGKGAAISGEGLVGLTHAFLIAGTARVVASEWAVNDQATAELMGLFYDGLLRRHLNPSRALQQAQLSLARQEPWRRPYYWAAFVVQGGF